MSTTRIHEVDFCAQMASEINALIAKSSAAFPFHEARVEGFGTGKSARRRKDLRSFNKDGSLVLCGEVKLPGTLEGRLAMNHALVSDAAAKADDAGNGPHGVESQIFEGEHNFIAHLFRPVRDGDRLIPARQFAIEWADEMRRAIESYQR